MNNISELIGKTLTKVTKHTLYDDQIFFYSDTGKVYKMFHDQECCEGVYIEDITGNLDDLVGNPILMAEEISNYDESDDAIKTWTFYKLATVKGYVTIRWCGISNGYYSTSVSFIELNDNDFLEEDSSEYVVLSSTKDILRFDTNYEARSLASMSSMTIQDL